ncbi:MAG TPA: hypothetical protein VLI42_09735, partial [Chthoniobacterales bacterium]|nr:hypothetical protein [Chthoniobacterales bacterium]
MEPVIHFDARHRALVLFLVGLFVVSVGLHLHGFSLAEWHEQLDGSPPNEVLFGQPRIIRMDDWAAALCTILAQREHHPAFPVVNQNIGLGANMVVSPIKTPVLHYVTLFRPHLWGYFLGRDLGLAWHWWTLLLGLFYSYFLCFLLVSGGRFLVAVSGALLIACSPFFQFKSLEYGEIAIFAGLIFVAFAMVVFSPSRRQRVVGGLFFGWSAGGLALNFYPASQIPLAYLMGFLAAGFLLQHRVTLRAQGEWRHRLICLGGGAALAALAVGAFVVQGWPILQILNHTVFPGQRFVTGGDYPCWRIFANDFFLQCFLTHNLPGTNISEYGSFLFFFPLLAVWAGYRMWREREINFVVLSIVLFCFALTTFAILGFPAWLSALTFMSKVPPNRSMVALGAANAALLCAVVSWPHPNEPGKAAAFILTACWGIFLVSVATSITRNYSAVPFSELLLPAVGLTMLGYGLMRERLKHASLLLLALVSIGASCWFNPLVRGGSAYLYRNPLAAKMRSLSAHHPGARWATFGNMFLPDYPRLLGLPAINGTEPCPQFDFWARLDPQRREFDEY